MKWLQLSDLHIKGCADWELMKKSYDKILSKEKIDFIVVTGDLHNFKDNYSDTKQFLDEIVKSTKINKENLYIIPGNHDASQFEMKEACVEYILNHLKDDSECYVKYNKQLKLSFEKYETFLKEYFEKYDYSFENIQTYKWKENLNIICINTALISDGKNDHKQIIDILELAKLKINNNLPTIAIGHHDINNLFEEHQKTLSRVFTELNVAAYLCGDQHKDTTENIINHSLSNYTIPCIVCGKSSIDNTDKYSDNSFIIYESDNSESTKVIVRLYEWNSEKKCFQESNKLDADNEKLNFKLFPSERTQIPKNEIHIKRESEYDDIIKLEGYVLIGPRGKEGIKYLWRKNEQIVESLAFNKRPSTIDTEKISAYSSSISHGCILSADKSQCIFCETGKGGFKGYLTAEDIALQNIFMAEYDSDCPSYPEVRTHLREFAYMGQGEPGHAYHLIRKSILLTDHAMNKIEQSISRYIISTCGVCGFIPLLENDLMNNFKNKVSLQFSLNAIGDDRNILMPVNRNNDFKKIIKECESFFANIKEKIVVSIIIFNNIKIDNGNLIYSYTLSKEKLREILGVLDPQIFRINLKDFNSNSIFNLASVSNEFANGLLNEAIRMGFEAKVVSCFGEREMSACGMLGSSLVDICKPGETTIGHYERAIKLLIEAKEFYGE